MFKLTKKFKEKVEKPLFAGFYLHSEARDSQMRLVTGDEKWIQLYWIVDESDGVIADCRYQAFGPPALIACLEAVCELTLHKNYHQASRITADLIDQHLREKKEIPSFSREMFPYLNQVLSAIDRSVEQCEDLPYAADHDVTPIEFDFGEIPGGIPGWDEFSIEQKLKIIEEVIDKEIRPYIELDAGGIKVLSLENNFEVIIAYEGSCTSCHSSTGSTLTAIQKILKARVHPTLVVIPKL
jgi:NifU-like protein